jgi:hypothetical protein
MAAHIPVKSYCSLLFLKNTATISDSEMLLFAVFSKPQTTTDDSITLSPWAIFFERLPV